MSKGWLFAAALIMAIASHWIGYRSGAGANEAVHVAADLAQAQLQAEAQAKVLTAEADTRQFAIAQEDAARAEPVQNPSCLSHSRVLRLKAFDAKP